jgi:tetratricopeptide (TPR) repeat protein
VLATSRGDHDEAVAQLERSAALAATLPGQGVLAAARNNLALAHRAAGRLEPAILLTTGALELVSAQGDRHREAALHNNLADLFHAAGRADEAMDHLKQAVAIFAEVGEPGRLQPEIWRLVDW